MLCMIDIVLYMLIVFFPPMYLCRPCCDGTGGQDCGGRPGSQKRSRGHIKNDTLVFFCFCLMVQLVLQGMVKESVNISKYKYIRAMSMWQGDKVVTRSRQTTDWCFPEDFDNLFPLFS